MKNILKSEYALLIAIFLLGIGFNFFLSAYTTFWIDESMVVNLSYANNAKIISTLLTTEAHPPVYYFLIKAVRIIFGDRELYFRLISSLFFVLTSIYIFLLGRKIGGKETGLISLAMWSSNYFLLFYSKQARPYSLLAFLSIASLYYFCNLLISKEAERKDVWLYLLFTIIGLYTNYWFALLLLAQFIILFIADRKNKKARLTLIGAGLAFLPWAIFYLISFNNYSIGQFIDKPGLGTIWESLGYFGWGQWWLIIPAGLGSLIYGIIKKNIDFKKLYFLLYYFFIVIGLAFFISQFIPIYTPGRREIVLVPVFIIASAYLFSRIENKWWQIGLSCLMILFTYQTILSFNAEANAWKSSDLSLMQAVQTEAKNDDYFIVYGLTNVNVNYYARRLGMQNNEIYFPSAMEFNQDSLGPVQQIASEKEKLNDSLANLKDILTSINRGKFFVFLTDDNISNSMMDFFDLSFKRIGEIIPEQPHMPTWISRVIIYDPSMKTRGHGDKIEP